MRPTLVPLVGHVPFPLQPPSRRAAEEETAGTTVVGARPPDASLSLPTSPDKQPAWTRAFPLPTVEEKQWHQSCSIQTNIVPINVSGRAASPRRGGGRGARGSPSAEPAPGGGCGAQARARPGTRRQRWGARRWEGAGAASLCPRGPGGCRGQSRGQQGRAGVCHPQPSLLPSCVRSTGHATVRLSFPPCCPASRFCCHLGSRRAPCGPPVSPVCPSIRPSIRPSSQGCSSRLVLAGTSTTLCPRVGARGQRLSTRFAEGKRGFSAPSLRDGETCRDHAGPPRPPLLFLMSMSPVWLSTAGLVNDTAPGCGVRAQQHSPEPGAQSRAGGRSSLCIPPPSEHLCLPAGRGGAVPPSPARPTPHHHHPPPSHAPACRRHPRLGDTQGTHGDGGGPSPHPGSPSRHHHEQRVCFGYRAALC